MRFHDDVCIWSQVGFPPNSTPRHPIYLDLTGTLPITGSSLQTSMAGPVVPPKPTSISIPKRRPPRKKALLIGIQSSGQGTSEPALDGPHLDVKQMKELLLSRGYKEENIVVMRDGGDGPLVPTRCNMVRAMRNLVRDAQPGDRLVFHFSGHSGELTNWTGTEEDGKDQALETCDDKLIRDNDLKRYLVRPLRPGVTLIAIFDTCHSGTMLDLPHHRCNAVWVPWYSKGARKTATLQSCQVHRNAMIHCSDIPFRLKKAVHQGHLFPAAISIDVALQDIEKHAARNKEIRENMNPITFGNGPICQIRKKLHARRHPRTVGLAMEAMFNGVISPTRGQLRPEFSDNESIFYGTTSSPIERCQSPTPYNLQLECDGWCRDKGGCYGPTEKPYVISMSACKDSQFAWEDSKGKSMTQVLVEFLREQPDPSLKDLLTHVSHRIHSHLRELHQVARERRKKRGKDTLEADRELEKDNFQDPELASLHPLDLYEKFTL